MGVCPCGAQVRTTLGISRKPDSSARRCGRPTERRFFYARPVLSFPTFDLFFIALQRTPLRFLRSPSQAVHQTPDMVRMVADSELAFNHLGNARRGPQIGPVTLSHRSLKKQTDKPLSLRG